MAAAGISNIAKPTQHIMPLNIQFTSVTTGDWINIAGCRGVHLPAALAITSSTNNSAPDVGTCQYGSALSTAIYAATATSIAVDGANADNTNYRQAPFYVKCKNGEIMEVTADSTPKAATSTWTVRRGCLGTTAAAVADNDYFDICNQIVVASTRVGFVTGLAFPMSEDPGAPVYSAAKR